MEKLRDKLSMVLKNLQKEKEEEKVIVDIWCHFGHAYITDVDEGEWKIFFVSVVVLKDSGLSPFRWICRVIFRVKRTKQHKYPFAKFAFASQKQFNFGFYAGYDFIWITSCSISSRPPSRSYSARVALWESFLRITWESRWNISSLHTAATPAVLTAVKT